MSKTEKTTDHAPLPCLEMEDIRRDIDALDRRLIDLLKQRLDLVSRAGKVKLNREQVIDHPRIEEVIALVVAEGNKKGIPESIVEPLWQLLIDRSIDYEFAVFDKKSD